MKPLKKEGKEDKKMNVMSMMKKPKTATQDVLSSPLKPLFTTTEKCRECNGTKWIRNKTMPELKLPCETCQATGKITKKYYPLREFEIKTILSKVWGKIIVIDNIKYSIPYSFKNYEIRKVSEITEEEAERALVHTHGKEIRFGHFRTWLLYELQEKHNLKAEDKLVVEKC